MAAKAVGRILEAWVRNGNDLAAAMAPWAALHSAPWWTVFALQELGESKKAELEAAESEEEEEEENDEEEGEGEEIGGDGGTGSKHVHGAGCKHSHGGAGKAAHTAAATEGGTEDSSAGTVTDSPADYDPAAIIAAVNAKPVKGKRKSEREEQVEAWRELRDEKAEHLSDSLTILRVRLGMPHVTIP